MPGGRIAVIGGGLGGLASAMELNRRGYDVVILERKNAVGGKASSRSEGGWRWDEGPSILVMPWVYRELFASSGLDPERYLRLRRLDPAFRTILSDGRPLTIPSDAAGLRDAFGAIDPADAAGLDRFLAKMDRFANLIGHAYCDRILENWGQVMFSPLLLSAALISPAKSYASEIDEHFRSPAVRELLYGFPTYSGFDPKTAPASLAIIPWTIIREGVWYPEEGGIAAIPRAMASACRDLGVAIRTGVEVEAIELDAHNRVRSIATSDGAIEVDAVVSNSDYVHTHKMLRGGRGFTPEVESLRAGKASPSSSFLTVQLGCDRTWPELAHHLLVLTEGSGRVYDELFVRGEYPSDPPIYVNATSVTDPDDAPAGGSNPFIVIGAPPIRPGIEPDREFEARHAEAIIARLEKAGLDGLGSSGPIRRVTGPGDWRREFHAFLGSIYGLGNAHNILGGSFRPLNYRVDVPGLYFVGGGVQPGAGMPMVVQSGKITAERIARDLPIRPGQAADERCDPVIVAILWTLLALNLLRRLGSYRFLRPIERPLPSGTPTIDVIVPARNEEAVFESSLGSILRQEYADLRVIAVDDQSTDRTLAIMERLASDDPRVVVVPGQERPSGWVGKTWAVHQGYLRSSSDWICFIDADMDLHPRALATALMLAERQSADMVSLMPRVECRSFWQGTIAVSFLQVLAQLYPLDRGERPERPTAIAAGGFILVRRAAYERAGGHEAGRHDIVDDIQLARRVKAAGGRLYVRLAPDLASTHMYGSFRAIWRGLRKNAYAGMGYQFHKFAFGMVGALLLAWSPIIAILYGIVSRSTWSLTVGVWGWLAQAAASLPIAIFLRISPLYAFTLPAGITAYVAIAASSVWHHHRGRILWKDRTLSSSIVEPVVPSNDAAP